METCQTFSRLKSCMVGHRTEQPADPAPIGCGEDPYAAR